MDFLTWLRSFFGKLTPIPAVKPFVVMQNVSDLSDIEVISRTIWGESRNQGIEGMTAVANVIQNRATKGGWWGRTPRDVCLKPNQFSCWRFDDPNRAKLLAVTIADPQFQVCMSLANSVLTGTLSDNTEGATSYQVRGTNAWWSKGLTPVASIGTQDFYRA